MPTPVPLTHLTHRRVCELGHFIFVIDGSFAKCLGALHEIFKNTLTAIVECGILCSIIKLCTYFTVVIELLLLLALLVP